MTVPNANAVRLDELAAAEVTACVVDLTAVSVEEIATAAQSLQKRFAPVQLIAFGPHVSEQHLAAAQAAGFDSVLTLGQLNANIDRHMQHWQFKSRNPTSSYSSVLSLFAPLPISAHSALCDLLFQHLNPHHSIPK